MSSLRDRLDRALKREPKTPDPPGVTIPASLVRSSKLASWMAFAALVYFLWLYTLDIARDRSAALELTQAGMWSGEIKFWFPYIVGFGLVAVGIPYVAKIAIPVFMSLSWKREAWPKAWALLIAVAVSLVVIAGTFSVQAKSLVERGRDSAVDVAEIEQQRAATEAQIAAITSDLDKAMSNPNRVLAQAASVGALGGAAEWKRSYVDVARTQGAANADILERATGAARAAEAAVQRRDALRAELASMTTVTAVQETVASAQTGWLSATMGWLEGSRAILLALVMDIVCLIMPWIALRLEQARALQLARAAGAVQAPTVEPMGREFQIEDHSDEAPIVPDLDGARADVMDAMFEDLKAKRSEASRKGWAKRKGQLDETGVQSPSDARATPPAEAVAAEAVAAEAPEPPPSAPPIEQEDAMRMVDEGRAELVEDDQGRQFIRMLEKEEVYGPPAPARQTALPNGEGAMVH